MKIIKKTMYLMLFLTLTSVPNSCCLDDCEIKKAADLLIPVALKLYNQYGQPILDNNGQQMHGQNAIFYNERTGEYFNQDYPPKLGVMVGDFLQVGTRIFNKWVDNSCEKGKDAGASKTEPRLFASLTNGQSGMLDLPGMPTPPIPVGGGLSNISNNSGFTATKFQFLGAGNYSVGFGANKNRNVVEFNFDNNYYEGSGNNYGKPSKDGGNSFFIEVSPNPNYKSAENLESSINFSEAPRTIKDMEALKISKFVNSNEYIDWYINKIKNNL